MWKELEKWENLSFLKLGICLLSKKYRLDKERYNERCTSYIKKNKCVLLLIKYEKIETFALLNYHYTYYLNTDN